MISFELILKFGGIVAILGVAFLCYEIFVMVRTNRRIREENNIKDGYFKSEKYRDLIDEHFGDLL